ncbi:hypothetical protein SAMN06269185_1064 [Natronoarchaeum philippinense]|uniref:Uncharacterized protein n=1 Tax=Natronoarchaeum philippinense TaxID=558529 RepID=A0A285NB53_NATPI|nr:hypothetical protein [Natronoarchaeum philippinense]SNZ06143.1 hypothetical protein SAMN06269185_1064 [Natronoarchaeum philippinense]
MKGGLWTVVVVVVFLVAMMSGAVGTQTDQVTSTAQVDNESQTLTSSTWTDLDRADEVVRVHANETVRTDNGTVLDRGTDYKMDYQDAEIRATANSSAAGSAVNITYAYVTADETSRGVLALLGVLSPFLGYALLIIGAVVLISWLGVLK